MNTINELNIWAAAHKLGNFRAELSATGKAGSIPAATITADATALSAIIASADWPVSAADFTRDGKSILSQVPGAPGMFRAKLPLAKFVVADELDIFSTARVGGIATDSTPWIHPEYANSSNSGLRVGCTMAALGAFLAEYSCEETTQTVTFVSAPDTHGVRTCYEYRSVDQDDRGKSGSTDGFTPSLTARLLFGVVAQWAKTGIPNRSLRQGSTCEVFQLVSTDAVGEVIA